MQPFSSQTSDQLVTPIASLDQKFQQGSSVLAASIHEETVMLCVDRALYFSVDEIGARIWEILKEPHSLSEICDILNREYDVDHVTAMSAVGTFLKDLSANGLILPSPAGRQQ